MEKMIGCCGLDCAQCGAFLAFKNDDQALREKTAAEWTVMHNFNFTPDMINCTGCKGGGVQVCHCSVCEIRACACGKGLENCGTCADMKTCKPLNDFHAIVPCAAKNLA